MIAWVATRWANRRRPARAGVRRYRLLVRGLELVGVCVVLVAGCGSTKTITKTVSAPTPAPTNSPTTTLRVPSAAMEPTIPIGSVVAVALNPSYVPAVGDIVVFHPPEGAAPPGNGPPVCGDPKEGPGHPQPCGLPTPPESSQTFIKRVVGSPGDTIEIINGHVIRNGVAEKDSYILPCGGGPTCTFRDPIKIPAGDYFLLGDNRGGSDDSRFWGPIHGGWIIGKVVKLSPAH
jgi:signal peptidase I